MALQSGNKFLCHSFFVEKPMNYIHSIFDLVLFWDPTNPGHAGN